MANETTENELNQTGEPGTEYFMETLPGQDRYVAPLDETPLQDVDSVDESAPAASMWADAWRTLRRNPLFIISGLLILFIIVVAIAPGLFTKQDPNACDLGNSLSPASAGTPLRLRPAGLRRVHPRGLRHPYLTVRRRALHATGRDCRYPDRCRRRLLRRLGRRGAEPYHRHLLRAAYAAWRHRGASDVQDLQVHLGRSCWC